VVDLLHGAVDERYGLHAQVLATRPDVTELQARLSREIASGKIDLVKWAVGALTAQTALLHGAIEGSLPVEACRPHRHAGSRFAWHHSTGSAAHGPDSRRRSPSRVTPRTMPIAMTRLLATLAGAALLALAGCASRPVNPPLAQAHADGGYVFQARLKHFKSQDTLVVLAFSGGGTRAAAFSYGVLEYLRRTVVVAPDGSKLRLLDAVDMITGVSGGSFTALAYGLYGEKLFADYEQRFLKRDVQGELLARSLNPRYWGDYIGGSAGRSELAASYYDEILFNGATFGDLDRGEVPYVVASATDISTGSRVPFTQSVFDLMCSDLNAVRLSRAAAASSAVPVVLSTVTFDNHGGGCNIGLPAWIKTFTESDDPPRPAARVIRNLREGEALADGTNRPFIHLVDGGISDNVGMRGVLDALQLVEALHIVGQPTPLDRVKRIVVFVVNSLSSPPTTWDRSERGPGMVDVLLKSSGVPIDRYSYEAVELLKDISARWEGLRHLRELAGCSRDKESPVCAAIRVPQARIYAVDVSFAALKDPAEVDYLNRQPTTFVLPAEAVDRLRAAAGRIIAESPDFRQVLKDAGVTIAPDATRP
jgi:NTE family protein